VVGAASKYGSSTRNSNNGQISQGFVDHTYCFFIHFFIQNKEETKIKIPYFIGLFVLAMFANTYLPFVQIGYQFILTIAKSGLTTFFHRLRTFKRSLASVGYKPLLQGIVLWLLISSMALWVVISSNVYFTKTQMHL
jgi:uncharacterized membrane protein YadS